MIGVFINSKDVPYARWIVDGKKRIETRTRRMLHKLIGETVGIIETGNENPKIIGWVTIGRGYFCDRKMWENGERDLACVPVGSKFDLDRKWQDGKWCYELRSPIKMAQPYPLPKNAIRHGRVWCEFDII
jgi:hypothetical protein